ncbi:Longin-like domain-containing protein [Gorgonomyces haynaldii]|nr:Longin-like domain-containing protein [Gorgonomyces haynaldii]
MVKSTLIARVADGLPLAASMDDEESQDLSEYKNQARMLVKKLSTAEQRCSLDSNQYIFHYLIEFGVVYLALCEKGYPKKLAFAYLEELQHEFNQVHGNEVTTVARPYAFVRFDSFIQKTKKQYKDVRAQRNMQKLNEDLGDVTRIMNKNIQDVLGRGEQLEGLQFKSQTLAQESKKYLKDTKNLNLQALYQKYGPPVIVLLIVAFVLYIRTWWS